MTRPRKEHSLGRVTDFPKGSHRVCDVGGRALGIFNVRGSFHALPNLCPHQIGPLCEGRVSGTLAASEAHDWKLEWVHDGEIITCPWHGLEFHVPTGQCLAYPEIRLRSYEVWVEGEELKIRL
jgi:nitrite reductase/ring-hydroxylating ferredoxin subunit